jgi:hypothetical protein
VLGCLDRAGDACDRAAERASLRAEELAAHELLAHQCAVARDERSRSLRVCVERAREAVFTRARGPGEQEALHALFGCVDHAGERAPHPRGRDDHPARAKLLLAREQMTLSRDVALCFEQHVHEVGLEGA